MGFDHRGDEGMAELVRAANTGVLGPRTADTCYTSETRPPRDKPGSVVSNTPFKAVCPDLPPLSESPVPANQR